MTPEMVGLISYDGTRRRVKGLRREGVAAHAGVGVEVTLALLTW